MNKNKYEVLAGIEPIVYGTNSFHRLLAKDDNIGENGENLTIVVLSCERPQATINMMKTIKKEIPNFKGKYLIADNGSSQETIQQLKKECQQVPFECEILEFGKNLGVAKGRNEAIKHVNTNWFMSLDNDILFATNPLPEICKTIAQLGCFFVNLPLVNAEKNQIFSMGGNLFIEKMSNGIHIGCGSTYAQSNCIVPQIIPRCLCTFIFGGASVINTEKFKECGGFDEGMFVGFEDIDFSMSVFRNGYKVGTIGLLAFVHDHKKPENANDLEYERQRFSNVKLLESAMYFEKKHNFKIWNEATEEWLKEKEEQLGIKQERKSKKEEKKPILTIICNTRKSEENQKFLAKKYELEKEFSVRIIYLEDIDYNIVKFTFAIQKSDIVYILKKDFIQNLDKGKLEEYIKKFQFWNENFYNCYINSLNIFVNGQENIKWFDKEIGSCKFDVREIKKHIENN